jgi:hypothetical protein
MGSLGGAVSRLSARPLCNDASEREGLSIVHAQHLGLSRRHAVAAETNTDFGAALVPLCPQLPAVGQIVGDLDLDKARIGPMPTPPTGAVKAAEFPFPIGAKQLWWSFRQFLDETWRDNAKVAARANKLRDIAYIEVVGAKVVVGIKAQDGVEVAFGKGQYVSLGVNG